MFSPTKGPRYLVIYIIVMYTYNTFTLGLKVNSTLHFITFNFIPMPRSFQDHIETPITLIQAGMNPIGTLHAFSRGTAVGAKTSSQYHHYPTPS